MYNRKSKHGLQGCFGCKQLSCCVIYVVLDVKLELLYLVKQ